MTTTTPYCPIPNRFRQDLLARKRLIGCWCSLANPVTTEVLGLAGFDWLLLDAAQPEAQQAIRHLFERAQAAGKACGILAPVEADARRYLELGATFVAVGSDLGLFRSATQALRDKFAAVA